jgi:hypothetical protein
MCTLITSKGTDIDENIANQNHATRTRTPKSGYLNLSNNTWVRGNTIFISRVEHDISLVREISCSTREINMVFPSTMYYSVYYIKDSL